MELLDKLISESIDKYYKSLSLLGYKKDNDVFSLLVISFIEECLYKYFMGEVTNDDYREFAKAVYKLADNTCLIDYPNYEEYSELIRNFTGDYSFILNEDDTFRF